MNYIITLTPNAIEHIQKNIIAQNAIGFRLAVKKTGCSGYAYLPDIIHESKPEDIHYVFEELTLFIDPKSVPMLQGTEIDFVDHGLGQSKLIFNNPNAANLCGCGESFNLVDE